MKFLFCPIASHGFVYPAIGIAQVLRQRGHAVAFVTDQSFGDVLARVGIERIPRGSTDGRSFQVENWWNSLAVVMQVKHIEYALEHFAPDVLVTNPLTLGALLVGERQHIPVAVLGLAAYLWPTWKPDRPPQSPGEERLLCRHDEMLKWLNQARALFGLPPHTAHYLETPLLGDVFLLQSIRELEGNVEQLPAQVRLVGACVWEEPLVDTRLRDWLEQARAADVPLLYIQVGRTFDHPGFWPQIVEILQDLPVRVVASVGRLGQPLDELPPNFFVRDHVPQHQVLPYAQAVLSNANTTAVLGALTHGLPSLLFPQGGERPDVAERCVRSGAAMWLSPLNLTSDALRQGLERVLSSPLMHQRAQMLQQAFATVNGPERAADHLEELAIARRSGRVHTANSQ